ncbi:MAG: hypothetical protein ACKUBY_00600 [Candidatus Moraniibacteriota bacterium]|jgi:hypothetical protein
MKNFILKSINTILILIIILAPLRFDFLYIHKYINAWYGDDLYITTDVTWNSDTDLSEYGAVYIIDGATVTIEAGSHISIKHIVVQDAGRIVAVGDIDNKIVFTKTPFNEGNEFDEQCDLGGVSAFKFDTYEIDGYIFEPSFFKFVEFDGLGEYFDYNELHCPGIAIHDIITNNVYADEEAIRKAPAILHMSGQLDMENVIFKNSKYADIQVEMELEEDYNENSYVHIKNSNFEESGQNIAVISNVVVYDFEGEDICYDNCDDEYNNNQNDAIYDACCETCENDAMTHDSSKVILENNWYGHTNGPTGNFVNENGDDYAILAAGEKVSGDTNVLEYDWRGSSDFASNVLFLPGAKASRLYDGTNQVWPPTPGGDDYKNILLDEDGNSINDIFTEEPIYEAGLPSVLAPNIYKRFFGDLKNLKDDRIINDYSLYAYDWRKSVDDIAINGTNYEMSSIKNPISEVMRLSDSSVSGKVTIVAHSNGGLLAKSIMQQLEILNMTDKVDNIVMVSSPQMGTSKAILTMLYGFDEKIELNSVISDAEAREVVRNMPSAYGLLPTEEYFRRIDKPIINFKSEKSEYKKYKKAYGDTINSYDEFKDFLLAKKDNRHKPNKNDTKRANILNEKLFDENKELHEELNNWTPPENVNLIQIGGWGLDTISEIDYESITKVECEDKVTKEGIKRTKCKDVTVESYIPKYTVDGDNVVVTPSSLMMSESENVEKYFLDMYEENKGFAKDRKHKDILEVKSLRNLISNIISKHEIQEELSDYITKNRPDDTDAIKHSKHSAKRLRMALYSPLDIHLYDNQGNHTGPIIDENGNQIIEENMPNSYYDVFGEHKFVGWGGSDIIVELDGYNTGSYTIKLEEVSITEAGEEVTSYLTMENLPTSENTKVSFAIPRTGLENITRLTADYDGDGSNDYEVVPQINGTTTLEDGNDGSTVFSSSESNENKDDDKDNDDDDDEKNNITENIFNNESLRGGTTKQSLGDDVANEKDVISTEVEKSQNNTVENENKEIKDDNNSENKKSIKDILIGIFLLFLMIVSVFIFKKLIK